MLNAHFCVFTCVLAAVQLQVGELEVAFVAAWVGAHEGTLLAALCPDERRTDAGNAPHVLPTSKKAFLFGVKWRHDTPPNNKSHFIFSKRVHYGKLVNGSLPWKLAVTWLWSDWGPRGPLVTPVSRRSGVSPNIQAGEQQIKQGWEGKKPSLGPTIPPKCSAQEPPKPSAPRFFNVWYN